MAKTSIPSSPDPARALSGPRRAQAVLGLAVLYGLRLLGLYLILPVLSIYAATLGGATPLLIGLSLGIYGFAQALLQIPFGLWSDRYGRRRVISVGLLLFAVGSVLAAESTNLLGLILGRFLQGSGAIASAIVAMMADLSGPRYRARAMGAVGASVGIAFAVGMVFGPAIYDRLGAPALFWLTALLSLLGIAYVAFFIPPSEAHHDDSMEWTRGQSRVLLHDPAMLRLDVGIFVFHLLVTAALVVGPTYLSRFIPVEDHGRFYAPIVLGGVGLLAISVFAVDRWGRLKEAIVAGAILMLGAAVLMIFATRGLNYCLAVTACMIGAIAVAEPAMPAMLTHMVPSDQRGTAAGIFHTSQFMGSFAGGMLGGAMLSEPEIISYVLVTFAVVWVLLSLGLPRLHPMRDGAAPSGDEGQRPGAPAGG